MYEAVIGLEIHAELKTNTKIFCSCKNTFGAKPNTQVCPVCMGFPGVLPVLNKKVVDLAIKAGLALGCTISNTSKHDRKNYFYPDLPKGYQITQKDFPLCSNGYLEIGNKKIRILRIHIEEDAGKLIHYNNTTIVDFNRSGVPLVEIVTKPDISTSEEAVEFLQSLKTILEYLDVSDCKMEEGSLRCDVNVSLRPKKSENINTYCEIKNLNSFSATKNAIEYEIMRQTAIYDADKTVNHETLRWDDINKKTVPMRSKEVSLDYRYFPEPDLLPVYVSNEHVEAIRSDLPELPKTREARYIKEYNLSQYDSRILTSKKALADFFEKCVSLGADPKTVTNWLTQDILKILNEKGLSADLIPFSADNLVKMIDLIDNGTISKSAAKKVLMQMFENPKDPEEIIIKLNLVQLSDKAEIQAIIDQVLSAHHQSVVDYKNGHSHAFGFLIGQAMKLSCGKANPKVLNEVLLESLRK